MKSFIVCGNCSASVTFKKGDTNDEIGRWNLDMGVADSPGCHFHIQIRESANNSWFPSEVDVPRFPTFLITPVDLFDFVLSELYQNVWHEHVATRLSSKSLPVLQRKRLKSVMSWYLSELDESAGAIPWHILKKAKPVQGILVQ